MKDMLSTIQRKAVEAIEEEIREPRCGERMKFIEFYPIAEYGGIEIDIYQDENGKIDVTLWRDGVEVDDEELKRKIYDVLPDWDLVRVDCETDGESRYKGIEVYDRYGELHYV